MLIYLHETVATTIGHVNLSARNCILYKFGQSVRENFRSLVDGRTSDIVASKLSIGSGKQYEKGKCIVDDIILTHI